MGPGWAIQGLNQITRCPRTKAIDGAATMTLGQVHEILGARPHRLVGSLVDVGVLVREDDGRFVAPSQALLDLTLRLVDAGATPEVAGRAEGILRKRIAKGDDELVELFDQETGRAFAGKGSPEEIAAALATLRPIAMDAVGLILAQEIERSLRKLAAKRPSRKRRS